MLRWASLQDAIVATLRDIPAVVALVGGSAVNIAAYRYSWPKTVDSEEGIRSMTPPSILVMWRGTQPADFGGFPVIQHNIGLILMPTADVDELAEAVIDGVVTSTGQKFLENEPLAAVDSPDLVSILPNPQDAGDSTLEVIEILLSYREKSNQD